MVIKEAPIQAEVTSFGDPQEEMLRAIHWFILLSRPNSPWCSRSTFPFSLRGSQVLPAELRPPPQQLLNKLYAANFGNT
eukprot:jgi/Botrbrau1/270/Bobra.0022s0239.1